MQPLTSADAKGFFKSLFDFSFSSLIATKIIRFLYALIVILYSLFAVLFLISALLSKNIGVFLVALIFTPIIYLVYLIFARVLMEFLIVVFRIGEDVRAIRVGPAAAQAGGPAPTAQYPQQVATIPPTPPAPPAPYQQPSVTPPPPAPYQQPSVVPPPAPPAPPAPPPPPPPPPPPGTPPHQPQ